MTGGICGRPATCATTRSFPLNVTGDTITGMIRTFTLALTLLAPVLAAPPEGLYLRTVFANGSLQNHVFLFRGGQVARNPQGDLERFNFTAWKAAHPALYGSYTWNGAELRISWGDGLNVDGAVKLDKSGKGFSYRSDGYAPLLPLAPGAVLKGRFTGGAGGGGAMSAFDYTFDGAGGFTTNSAASVSTTSSRSTASAAASRAASGRYSVKGNILTLTFPGGRTELWPVYYAPTSAGPNQPDLLVANGLVLTKM